VHEVFADGEPAPGRELRSVQALEALRRPLRDGLVLAVSHEGGTHATLEALRAAQARREPDDKALSPSSSDQ
jgi:hypothetical protein